MTAVVILVAFFVGVPVLFIVLSRRRFWDRRRGRQREDLWGDWMRRHGLSAAEAGDISNGVTRGRRYTDPRLRAAAVDWAGTVLRTETPSRAVMIGFGIYLLLAVLAAAVLRATTGRPDDINWIGVAFWVLIGIWLVRRRRGVRRSIEVNQD